MNTKEEIINVLIGNICWRSWRGVSTVIFLEFGDKFSDRKGGELRRGTYTIGLTCPWQVFKGEALLFNDSNNLKELDQEVKIFEGSKITGVIFNSKAHEERIIFSNKLEIHAYHNKSDDQWHILTPDLQCIFYKEKIEIGSLGD